MCLKGLNVAERLSFVACWACWACMGGYDIRNNVQYAL